VINEESPLGDNFPCGFFMYLIFLPVLIYAFSPKNLYKKGGLKSTLTLRSPF